MQDLPVIQLDEIKMGKKPAGIGGFAIVRKGIYQERIVAVKTFCLPNSYDIIEGECVFKDPDYISNELDSTELNRMTNNFIFEARKMQTMKHPNIVKFIGFVPENMSIVMEYLPDGTLYHHIRDGKETTWKDRYQIALDVAEGMFYLHSNKDKEGQSKLVVFHQDLKSANILLCHDKAQRLRGKISDFGLSVLSGDKEKEYGSSKGSELSLTPSGENFVAHRGGTRVYMAPELFQSYKFTKSCDIYSYGVVLLEVATFQPPQQVHNMLARLKRTDIPSEMKRLIKDCLRLDPDKRPSFYDVTFRLKTEQFISSMADFLVKYKASTSRANETDRLSSCLASDMNSSVDDIKKSKDYSSKQSKLGQSSQHVPSIQISDHATAHEIPKRNSKWSFLQRKYRLLVIGSVVWIGLLLMGLQFGLRIFSGK